MSSLKTKLQNNRKLVFSCLSVILILAIAGVAGISAYLTDGDRAVNTAKVGGVKTEIVEEFDPPKAIVPGVSFVKDVKVKNPGPSSAYVRIKAVFTDSVMGDNCTLDWNEEDSRFNEVDGHWVKGTDGYWYFSEALEAGEMTESLFKNVTVSEDMDAALVKDFDILVYTESYQSYGFDSYERAWAHYRRNNPDNLK